MAGRLRVINPRTANRPLKWAPPDPGTDPRIMPPQQCVISPERGGASLDARVARRASGSGGSDADAWRVRSRR